MSSLNIPLFNKDQLQNMFNPIQKATILHSGVGRPKKNDDEKLKPTDKVICDICGGQFIRSNRTNHKKTKVCQAYFGMNEKLKNALLK